MKLITFLGKKALMIKKFLNSYLKIRKSLILLLELLSAECLVNINYTIDCCMYS